MIGVFHDPRLLDDLSDLVLTMDQGCLVYSSPGVVPKLSGAAPG